MRGYTLLSRRQYALVYGLTALALMLALVGTLVGLWSFGGLFWWPALALLVIVTVLEGHSVYVRRFA